MTFLGKITEECLLACGVNSTGIESIKYDKAEWEIVEATPEEGSNLLILILYPDDDQIQSHNIKCLTDQQAVILKRVSEYEGRNHNISEEKRHSAFPAGKINDWVGLDIVPSWVGLIKEYRKAANILSESSSSVPTPFLYMCRHTLELQLKNILLLDQKINANSGADKVTLNHNLGELWKKASPIAQSFNEELKKDQEFVGDVIEGYHEIDQPSTYLRYPNKLNNEPIKHKEYLQSFSKSRHAEKFQRASDTLDTVISSMEMKIIFDILGYSEQPLDLEGL